MRFLRFFNCVSWGILPSTNLADRADNCYTSLNFFLSPLFLSFFNLEFRNLLLSVSIVLSCVLFCSLSCPSFFLFPVLFSPSVYSLNILISLIVLFSNLLSFIFSWRVVWWLSLLHNFIQLNLNSGSAPARTLLAAYRRFAMVRISLTMVPAGNKSNRLSSVNHTRKTIHHHHHHHHHHHLLSYYSILPASPLCSITIQSVLFLLVFIFLDLSIKYFFAISFALASIFLYFFFLVRI